MTYAAGFYTPDAIYLTADTAASDSVEFSIHEDTFFAQPAKKEEFAVNDNRMKLFQISIGCLVAAAGDEEKIYICIGYLRMNWNVATSLNGLFDALETETRYRKNDVVLIVAASTTVGLRMGMWSSGSGYGWAAKEGGIPASAICSGSGREIPGLTENVSKGLNLVTKNTVENNLAFISTCHQLHAEHYDHVQHGVGGAFISAALTQTGIIWQPDITYFRYSQALLEKSKEGGKLKGFYPVSVLVREGITYVERRVPEFRGTIMDNAVPRGIAHRVRAIHDAETAEKGLHLASDFGAFLSGNHPYAALVHHFANDYCYQHNIESNVAHVRFNDDFLGKLLDRPKIGPNGFIKIYCAPDGLLKPDYAVRLQAAKEAFEASRQQSN